VSLLTVASHSVEDTRILGTCLAPVLTPGDVVSLNGDLGAGKTVFVQGLAGGLGVDRHVTSPTFVLVHHYEGRLRLAHVDVYRLSSFQEILDLGYEELFDPEGVVVVEWGDVVGPLLPPRYLHVSIHPSMDTTAADQRLLLYRSVGPGWEDKLERMRTTAEALLGAMSEEPGGSERFSSATLPPPRDDGGRQAPGDVEV
jgi:tRNA threonylcarbamoyladenosine biosynthesis protein TsaE